ncbi:SAM-dependent methyltransferase [Luteolibacter arcticus]|uniref:SAM-dependent methyltransferase n=1 Tax=Luteolibacter arcticus TaxID=1581411 RepID=A0ABT3GMW5_9BACT|nr:SAM-dependent methyltransferase [Luteolibacter arcticus]MCW1924863.1 SAM-dependent methyltransferase [Luteolibacter arcticus]
MNPSDWPWRDATPLRFDRFMELALHDPERGYYARRIRGVGRGGDFTTTPMLTPALGKAVSSWSKGALKGSGCRDLIELGPGEGVLAEAVMKTFPWWKKPRLHLVERSVPLREKQAARLGKRVIWHDTIESALDACGGKACIYSNEFADAFPVRRFRRDTDGWSELFLTPQESWQPCESLPESTVFTLTFSPGQIVEVAESYHDWLRGWLPHWKAGRMLTIDYGALVEPLYHRRPRGTVRAYLLQQRLEGPAIYENPGRQDLTTDVNFTDLQAWSSPQAETVKLTTQREFLLPHANPADPADAHAVDADGAGGSFLVLEQRAKPVNEPAPRAS